MVLILSKRNDGSTNRIIDWLTSFNKEFYRINGDDDMTQIIELSEDEIIVGQENKKTNILNSEVVWFRRRAFSLKSFNHNSSKQSLRAVLFDNDIYLINRLKDEIEVIIEYIYHKIESTSGYTFSSYFKRDLNKLNTIELAKTVGFKTPRFSIVNTKEDVTNKLNKGGLITKALKDGVYLIDRDYGYYSYTERISTSDLKINIAKKFFPSLVQSEIKKKYELRVFYLFGKIYSTAIFSQNKKETRVDHRRYSNRPPRNLPYKLPTKIEEKVCRLMEVLGLDIGAIDLIVDNKNEYFFLEVNPIGQFSFYSDQCNYYIEKELASEMINRANK